MTDLRGKIAKLGVLEGEVLECKERLAKVIRSCDGNDNEKKMLKRMLYDLTEENRLKQKGFAAVYDILHSLQESEAKVLETLFFYKITNNDELN